MIASLIGAEAFGNDPLDPVHMLDDFGENTDHNDLSIALPPAAIVESSWEKCELPNSNEINFAKNVTVSDNGDFFLVHKPSTPANRQFWQARLSAPDMQSQNPTQHEIQSLISKLNAVQFGDLPSVSNSEPPKQEVVPHTEEKHPASPEPKIVTVPQNTEPKPEIEVETPDTMRQPVPDSDSSTDDKLSPANIQKLKELINTNPNDIENPLILAEMLFHSNCLKIAAQYYEIAFDQFEEDDTSNTPAWVLLQIGNCLKDSDSIAAIQAYTKLIEIYPTSPWAQLAKSRIRLLNWMVQNDPKTKIQSAKQLLKMEAARD